MVVSLASTTQDSVSQPLTVVITPSRAQSYSICPYRYANEPRRFDRPSKSQDLGQWYLIKNLGAGYTEATE